MGIAERLGPFLTAPLHPAARTVICWSEGDPPAALPGDPIFDPGSIWRMYCNADGTIYTALISYPGEDGRSRQAMLTTNAAWDDIVLTERRDGPAWRSLVAFGVGEIIFRTRVIFADGLVFHASGIDDNGKGIVFVGHSGAGKSTQVGLWSKFPGVTAMNDDRIAVRVKNGNAVAYGTPWGGTANIARNHRAPLAAIVVLEQATENEIHPVQQSAAAPLLLPRTFLPYWDQALMCQAIDILGRLLDCVPVYRLRCQPEPDVIPLVRSIL